AADRGERRAGAAPAPRRCHHGGALGEGAGLRHPRRLGREDRHRACQAPRQVGAGAGGGGAAAVPALVRRAGRGHDNPALGESMIAATRPGDLWLVDKGLTDRERLLAIHQREGGFLVPRKDQALRVLATVWTAPTAEPAPLPPPVAAGSGPPRPPAPCRLRRGEQAGFENQQDARSAQQREKWA